MGRVKVLAACFYPSEMTGVDQVGGIAKMPRLLFILLAIFGGPPGRRMKSAEEQRCATDGGLGGGSLRHAVSIFNDPTPAGAVHSKKRPIVGCTNCCFICNN